MVFTMDRKFACYMLEKIDTQEKDWYVNDLPIPRLFLHREPAKQTRQKQATYFLRMLKKVEKDMPLQDIIDWIYEDYYVKAFQFKSWKLIIENTNEYDKILLIRDAQDNIKTYLRLKFLPVSEWHGE